MKVDSLKQAWLVLLLAMAFGGILAGVQLAWGPKIEQNREDDARGQVAVLVPGAEAELTPEGQDLLIEDDRGARCYRIYRAMRTGPAGKPEQVGWVLKAGGPGYADNIELLIGLDFEVETITGLYVLAQNETPGLGNKIKADKWRGQFTNKSARAALTAQKKGGVESESDIEAVSGATISSESVCKIVNTAVADFRRKLPELKGER